MIHTYLRLGLRKSFTATEKDLKCVRYNETSLYASGASSLHEWQVVTDWSIDLTDPSEQDRAEEVESAAVTGHCTLSQAGHPSHTTSAGIHPGLTTSHWW